MSAAPEKRMTSVRVDRDVLEAARLLLHRERRTLAELVEQTLSEYVKANLGEVEAMRSTLETRLATHPNAGEAHRNGQGDRP
jgi:hypothetical protein